MQTLEDYTNFTNIGQESTKCQDKLIAFQTNSDKLLSKVHITVSEGENFKQIKNLSVNKYAKTSESNKAKHLYFGILITLLIFVVFAIVLCVLGVLL